VLASSAVDRGIESWSGQTKDYKIGICCFSAKHAALRSKIKDNVIRTLARIVQLSIVSLHPPDEISEIFYVTVLPTEQ
jgi:hypothetical protein